MAHAHVPLFQQGIATRTKIAAALLIPVFALVVALQWTGGAYRAEFGGHPDEAAHYVTGLMIRDYIAAGLPGNPMAFAENYYDHYPKVALGNWPPGFYIIQSIWTLPFSPTRASVLLLMALLTSLVAVLVIRELLHEFRLPCALLGGLVFIAFPLVQQHAAMVMTEIPVALFSLAAIVCFSRYLERERTIDSVMFGLFASAAIMTKGSGLVLAVVPPFALLFTGRFDLLKRRNFWYPVFIVAILCGPWTWMFRDVASDGWQEDGLSWRYTREAALHFPGVLANGASLVITVFAAIGLIAAVANGRREQRAPLWPVAAALVVSVLIFHSLVPASLDSRHIIQAFPAWAMLAVVGVSFVERRVSASALSWRWVPFAVALAGVVHTAWISPKKQCGGFGAVVADIATRPENADAVFLVSSDATGEGMFIAETAMRETRPGHIVRRASKLLATQSWSGSDYHATVDNEAELIALLKKEKIKFLVLDSSIPESLLAPHHELLRKAVANPAHFALRRTYPLTRDYLVRPRGKLYPEGIAVYEMRDAAEPVVASSHE